MLSAKKKAKQQLTGIQSKQSNFRYICMRKFANLEKAVRCA